MTELEELEFHKRQIADAKEGLATFIELNWPEGSVISWINRGGIQTGEVLHTYSDRIKVRNHRTKAEYWVDIYWVAEALKLQAQQQAA